MDIGTIRPFNPFGKSLQDLDVEDLKVLRQTAEGWFVEYKSVMGNAATVGKSLAAFANHYGGWLFYGVQEASDASRQAETFPGITLKDAGRLELRLREAAAQ